MKKIVLSITLLSLLSVYSLVQAQGLGVGIKAGANFANQSITNVSTDSKTGFHGGVYAVIAFSEKWGLQPELLYSSQGSEVPNGVNDFTYMNIPILLRWKPISFLSIEAGPQFSVLLDAKNQSGSSLKDQVNNSDFGLALGATVHLPLGFNAGLRYVWGFTNVSNVGGDHEVKNTTVQLFAGWTLFGKK